MGNSNSNSPTKEIIETGEDGAKNTTIGEKSLRRRSRSEADMGQFVSRAITRTLSHMDEVQSSILSSFFIAPSHFKHVKVLAAGGGGQILRAHFDDELVALVRLSLSLSLSLSLLYVDHTHTHSHIHTQKRTYGLAMGGMDDAESLKEFLKEAEMMISLAHPNILRLFGVTLFKNDCGIETDQDIVLEASVKDLSNLDMSTYELRMVCELCKTSLQRVLSGDQKLHITHRESIRWSAQLASALRYLSDHDILHLDVKPDNVLLDNRYHVKLCDFGISSSLKSTTLDEKSKVSCCVRCTKPFGMLRPKYNCGICGKVVCGSCSKRNMRVPGRLRLQRVCMECEKRCQDIQTMTLVHMGLGTTMFMAPEQLRAEIGDVLSYPKTIDVWAFGVVLWMMAERCMLELFLFYVLVFSSPITHTHTHTHTHRYNRRKRRTKSVRQQNERNADTKVRERGKRSESKSYKLTSGSDHRVLSSRESQATTIIFEAS